MNRLALSRLLGLLVTSIGLTLAAEETSYTNVDGTTYRVTKRVVKRPVAQTTVEPRTQTVYSTEYVTEMRESPRSGVRTAPRDALGTPHADCA
jgi:hypothetical protein